MLKKIGAAVVAVAPLSAMAEVPTNVSSAISGAGTDAATVAGLVLVAVLGILAFKWMGRVIK